MAEDAERNLFWYRIYAIFIFTPFMLPIIGMISENTSLITSLLFQAATLTLIFLLLGYWYTKIPKKHFLVKKEVQDRQ